MRESWDGRIQRAERLASEQSAAAPLLSFYAAVLKSQRDLDSHLRSTPQWQPTGSLERDLPIVRSAAVALVRATAASAPAPLADQARALLDGADATVDEALLEWWRAPSDRQFYPKAALQPYGQWLAEIPTRPDGRNFIGSDNRCPFCGGAPQVAILRADTGGDGGGRWLLCANCLTSWKSRRVWCLSCGEEDERKLGYLHAAEFPHVRLDTCESCRRYVKTIDLTRLGHAVPLVDDVASSALDLLARERGYEKIELNLVGL